MPKKARWASRAAVLVFSIYLIAGLLVVKDYGAGIDEPMDRANGLAAYVHVMGGVMKNSDRGGVREAAENAPDYLTWPDRYSGAALQSFTVMFEHLSGFKAQERSVFLMRHVFVFLNFYIAGMFFYFLLRRRFGNTWIPLAGALMYILYPRFFGEAFFNTRDILFCAWFVIAAYFVARWLEEGRIPYVLLSAAALAVATNTRILGLSLLFLACVFSIAIGIRQKDDSVNIVMKPLTLLALTFSLYVAITPITWGDPARNTYRILRHFAEGLPGKGPGFYLGETIAQGAPWNYVTVWMGATVPLAYIIMFGAGVVFVCVGIVSYFRKAGKNKNTRALSINNADNRNNNNIIIGNIANCGFGMYDLFFTALFFCMIAGFAGFGIGMGDGWRQAYSMFFPFLFIAVFGMERVFALLPSSRPPLRGGAAVLIAICLCLQFLWITANHPYQYAYFNIAGRQIAEKNFTLDDWGVSQIDLVRKALASDRQPFITVYGGKWGWKNELLMTEEEKARVFWAHDWTASYYLQDTGNAYEDRKPPSGFVEFASITVDGMAISKLYKRTHPLPHTDSTVWKNVERFSGNASQDYDALRDGDKDTYWGADRPQRYGDYLVIEFKEAVDYNYVYLLSDLYQDSFPRDLRISVSEDGAVWTEAPYTGTYTFTEDPGEYRFIKLENRGFAEAPWQIYEMGFGRAGK